MIVVDASVAVKILSRERGADAALERVSAEDARCAPDWLRLEVGNAMARKVREKAITPEDAWAAADGVRALVEEQVDSLALLRDAFSLSVAVGHPMYDCLYLALGMQRRIVTVTADRRFAERAAAADLARHVELMV